jgi:hypothetical protein
MNSFVQSVAILAGLSFGPYANAASPAATNHYFGASYYQNSTGFTTDAGDISSDLDNIMFSYGWTFAPHLSIEARAGLSAKKSNDTATNGVTTSAVNDSLYGAFLRGSLPLSSQNITVYGLVGMSSASNTYTTESLTTGALSYTTTKTGLSYGVGAELFGTPSTSFHVEWTKYLSATDLTSKGFVLGITHHFSMSKPW